MMSILEGICKYNKTDKEITFPNGSKIVCGYCDNDSDARQYQGLEYDVVFIYEATQLKEDWIKKIATSVRGTNGYPKRIYYTCNPGGEGHGYIKRLFIDRKFEQNERPEDYTFIQSLVTDNKVLMETDPDYVRFLESLPRVLREAWLNGRWDVFEGAYFEEFRISPDIEMCREAGISPEEALEEHRWTHVITPFEVPKDWKIYRSYDWGYGKPFSFSWWAEDYDGILYQILEWYGCTSTPNEGIKWTNEQQFKHAREIEDNHRWLKGKHIYGVADPSIWDGSHDRDGISAAETAEKYGIYFDPANNERVAGWMQVRERLKFDENGMAMLYIFDTCVHAVRTFPLQMFDKHKVEDLDTSLEDHYLDSCRYMCMQRIIPPRNIEAKLNPISDPLNQLTKYEKYNKYQVLKR